MFKLDMIVHDSFFPFDRAADSARLFFGQRNQVFRPIATLKRFANLRDLRDNNFSNSLIIHAELSYPTRASYSGQVDEFRNPMKNELKTRPCLKPLFEIILNTDANFFNLHIDKATKTRGDKQLFNHTFYETNFKPKLFTANVECNGIVIKLPKTEKTIFLKKFSLNDGDLVFWFTFNLAVDFRTKMALTLEILSDQMHTLPRNSAEHKLFLFFASFRRSIYINLHSAICFAKQRVRLELTNS